MRKGIRYTVMGATLALALNFGCIVQPYVCGTVNRTYAADSGISAGAEADIGTASGSSIRKRAKRALIRVRI